VSGGLTFSTISAGAWHTCGLTAAGAAYCWGLGSNGQLGNGFYQNRTKPTKVRGDLAFTSITARPTVTARSFHTCAATTDGDAYCWGTGWGAQLGNGSTSDQSTPVRVSGGLAFSQLSAGEGHTCGVSTAGSAYCWGFGGNGQMGNGSTVNQLTPAAVTGGFTFSAISAGAWHTCGLTTAGSAYCWGMGSGGVLGIGSTGDQLVPVKVIEP
jgi:alpha-tubulin suppressor-like RCC1 family protein